MSNALTIKKLSGNIGAEIGGIDLAHASDAEIAAAFASVYAMLCERVVALREFALTRPDREQLVARMRALA